MHIDHADMNQVVHAAIFFFDKDYVYTHMHDEWMDGCAPEVCTEMQIHVEKNTKRNPDKPRRHSPMSNSYLQERW